MEIKQDPQSIQKVFKSLLQSSSLNEGAEGCLFNLVVYIHDPKRADYFQKIIKTVKTQFPCRVFFIQGDASTTDGILQIQPMSEKTGESNQLSTADQILIRAEGTALTKVYFLLLPLLIPDLPIYLLWGRDPTEEKILLPLLEEYAQRLIFDAETTINVQQFSQNMLQWMEKTSTQVVDINWARIGRWREVLTQIFDNEERVEQLKEVEEICIIYNNCPSKLFRHPDIQAHYLHAWLASRLKWQLQNIETKGEVRELSYKSSQGMHLIVLTPETNASFESEEILGIVINGKNGYTVDLKRIDSDKIQVHTSDQFQCKLPFVLSLPTFGSGRSFMQEIFYEKTSEQYKPLLELVSTITWSTKRDDSK